jgi:ectoine hydroxylase-related dioxygenase (phytanoyl-CoA dioxygenase family)
MAVMIIDQEGRTSCTILNNLYQDYLPSHKMQALFRDPILQEQYDRQGFLVMPFLSGNQVNDLRNLYHHVINPVEVTDLYESSRNNSQANNQIINESIYGVMKDSAEKIFQEVSFYGGTFMVKSCKNSSLLPLHQDWSVVEEEKYSTMFIWCPMQDVSPLNGGIFLLEGSHTYFNNLRSGSYPSNRYILPVAYKQWIKNIPVKSGEALIYSDKIFHGSHKNAGADDRIIATARVTTKNAPLVYFHKTKVDEVSVYQASSSFYLNHIDSIAKGNMPDHVPLLYKRNYQHREISVDDLQRKLDDDHSVTKKNAFMDCNLFKDPRLQEEFDKDGYAVIDLINSSAIDKLAAFYENSEKHIQPAQGFHVSLDHDNPDHVRTVSDQLMQTVKPELDRFFKDHQVFTASFVIKEKGTMGMVPPHQDWTFVNENQYWSATVWCPLVDVNFENGALGVIRGSHLFYDHVRPSPSRSFEPPFKSYIDAIFQYLKIVELKAGQAIVFNNKTIHGSPPNTVDQSRLAFGIGITHKEASLLHYYMLPDKDNELVEEYEISPSFFFKYNNARLSNLYSNGGKPEDLKSLGTFRYSCNNYERNEFINKMESTGNKINEKIEELFNQTVIQKPENQHEPTASRLPFWKVYTPINILKEIRYRVFKR